MFKWTPVTRVDTEVINRFGQNVQSAFAELGTPVALNVQAVTFTATVKSYTVAAADKYIAVNASGGSGVVVLPAPNRATQAVWIKKTQGSAEVKVMQSDGKPMGDGQTSFVLTDALMVNDGQAWWNFNGG